MKQSFLESGLALALREAQLGYDEGGIPIGSALYDADQSEISSGRNMRIQSDSQILHAEMSCIANAGRRPSFQGCTLFTTLSPCMMCSGTILQFGIRNVVIGENMTFGGNEDFLRERGVAVTLLQDEACIELMRRFIEENPSLWNEDIGQGE